MEQITLTAHAKINLSLDIIGRRVDGYHELDTVMQSISLSDTVHLKKTAGTALSVYCDNTALPQGENNIAYQAAMAYFQAAGLPARGLSISIKKHIPSQAGLGGGSADAAAVLRGCCLLFGPLLEDTLIQAGASVGADVPFCLTGGCRRAKGIGEQLSPLPLLPDCTILIGKPEIGMSTTSAYAAYDHLPAGQPPHTVTLITALHCGNLEQIGNALDNVFIKTVPLPAVETICSAMCIAGAAGACMSGSGTAVFGLFAKEAHAHRCMQALSGTQTAFFLCHPVDVGCQPVV